MGYYLNIDLKGQDHENVHLWFHESWNKALAIYYGDFFNNILKQSDSVSDDLLLRLKGESHQHNVYG